MNNALIASLLVIRQSLLPCLYYTKRFGQRPEHPENHLQTICEQDRFIQAHGAFATPVPLARKEGRPHSGGWSHTPRPHSWRSGIRQAMCLSLR